MKARWERWRNSEGEGCGGSEWKRREGGVRGRGREQEGAEREMGGEVLGRMDLRIELEEKDESCLKQSLVQYTYSWDVSVGVDPSPDPPATHKIL